jgi:hypothetical protein
METKRTATFHLTEERYPAHHALHATPHEMVRRVLEFELPEGNSQWEQSDYGHPGRFNGWETRGVDTKLQVKTPRLKEVAEAIGELLG